MTHDRAVEIINENAVWDSVEPRQFSGRPAQNAVQNIVDAIMCAVEEEREACAKIADHCAAESMREPGASNDEFQVGILWAALEIAKTIRARSTR